MFEPDKITRNGGPSNGSAQKDTPLREASKPLMLQGKMWVIARPPAPSKSSKSEIDKLNAEAKIIDARIREKLATMGAIGRLIGDEKHAPLYIVSALILITLVIFSVITYFDRSQIPVLVEVLKAVIYGSLGYIGARVTTPDK